MEENKPIKVTITEIKRFTKDKYGNDLKNKFGAPFSKVSIKPLEHKPHYFSGFGSKETDAWQVNDVVEIIVVKNGEYFNFSLPKKLDANYVTRQEFEDFKSNLWAHLKVKEKPQQELQKQKVDPEARPEIEIPF